MDGERTERGMGSGEMDIRRAGRQETTEIRIRIKIRTGTWGYWGWCGWDQGAVGGGGAFPAVAVLAGLNEDLFAWPRGGEAGEVKGGDVADAVNGGWQESQEDGASHAGPAGAAGGAGKDEEVAFGTGGNE